MTFTQEEYAEHIRAIADITRRGRIAAIEAALIDEGVQPILARVMAHQVVEMEEEGSA